MLSFSDFSLSSLSARIGWLGAFVSLAMLSLALLLVQASWRMKTSLDWLNHSEQVIHKIDETMADLREAESGQRGFLLTQDTSYARSFDYRTAEATSNVAALVRLSRDEPAQHARTVALQKIFAEKISSLRIPLTLGQSGHFAEAIKIVASGHGRDLMQNVARRGDQIRQEERDLLAVRLYSAEQQSAWNEVLPLFGGPIVVTLLVVFIILIIGSVRRPVRSVLRSIAAFRNGDHTARITDKMGTAEFRALAAAYNALADQLAAAGELQARSDAQLRQNAQALQVRSEVIELLGGMSHRMQTARTDEELANVIRRFVPRVLPGIPGAIYAHNHSRNLLVQLARWGTLKRTAASFSPDECWGLRRGQSHFSIVPETEIVCAHVGEDDAIYHCEPLLAGGEVIGLLYLEGVIDADSRFRLAMLTENIASALFNHQLQLGLREQTIRDPLTGLFNRRYMEEALRLEVGRALRNGTALALVMCDIDHFKRFNDEFGHDAGDILIRSVASEMSRHFRNDDVVCRYGGEEFMIIVPGADVATVFDRVEQLRSAIAETAIRHGDRTLGAVSMSFGIAMCDHDMALDGSTLMQLADSALYRAKRAGRDRTLIAEGHTKMLVAAE